MSTSNRPLHAVVDQAVTATASVAVVVAITRTHAAEAAGVLLVLQAFYLVALGLARAVVSLPAAIRSGRGRHWVRSDLDGTGVVLGLAVPAAVTGGYALLGPRSHLGTVVLLGGVFLAQALLEALRAHHGQRGDFAASARDSTTALLPGTVVVVGSLPLGYDSRWGLAVYAVSGVALLCAALGRRPTWSGPRRILSDPLVLSLGWNQGAVLLAQLLTPLAAVAGGSAAVAGALRVGQSVVGVPLQLTQGLQLPLMRHWSATPYGWRRRVVLWASAQAVLLGTCGLLGTLVTVRWGEVLFGDTAAHVSGALPLLFVSGFFGQLFLVLEMVARIRGNLVDLSTVRAAALVPLLLAVFVTSRWGVEEVAVALACVNAAMFAASAWLTRRPARRTVAA